MLLHGTKNIRDSLCFDQERIDSVEKLILYGIHPLQKIDFFSHFRNLKIIYLININFKVNDLNKLLKHFEHCINLDTIVINRCLFDTLPRQINNMNVSCLGLHLLKGFEVDKDCHFASVKEINISSIAFGYDEQIAIDETDTIEYATFEYNNKALFFPDRELREYKRHLMINGTSIGLPLGINNFSNLEKLNIHHMHIWHEYNFRNLQNLEEVEFDNCEMYAYPFYLNFCKKL